MARGFVRVDWRGPQTKAQAAQAAVLGLGNAAEHLLTQSRQVVPHRTGDLERSGRAEVDEEAMTAAVSYDTVYARRQHEELTWRHKPGRTAKYLERPLRQQKAAMLGLVQAAIRRAFR